MWRSPNSVGVPQATTNLEIGKLLIHSAEVMEEIQMGRSYMDGVADAIVEGNMLRARAAASSADLRAREAANDAARSAEEAAKYRAMYEQERGVSLGLQALSVALRNTYVLSLAQEQRVEAQERMIADARQWMQVNLNPDQIGVVRRAWLEGAANWNEELGLVPWPDLPPPVKPRMTQSEKGWLWKKTHYHVQGRTFMRREDAEAVEREALNDWRAACAVWARRQKKPDPSI